MDCIPVVVRFELELMPDSRSGYPSAFAQYANQFLNDVSSDEAKSFWQIARETVGDDSLDIWQDFLNAILSPVIHPAVWSPDYLRAEKEHGFDSFKRDIREHYRDSAEIIRAAAEHADGLRRALSGFSSLPEEFGLSDIDANSFREPLKQLIYRCDEAPNFHEALKARGGMFLSQKTSPVDYAREIRANLNKIFPDAKKYGKNGCLSILNQAGWWYLLSIICPGEFPDKDKIEDRLK